ncbi:MAG: DUF4321 domain-containing protein [Nitrospirae bacterium]|nr:DUF4321 domain-containing protein [Nitrospirota bacterium]
MALVKKTPWMLIFFIFIGGFFGTLMGEILRAISPDGTVRDLFLKSLSFGISPPFTLDLRLFTATIGFTIRINILGFIGIFLGLYIYKQA